ncbi:UTP--glucose-1-phosphate uridylyltransferase [Pseudodesulfovibrio sp. zrk46]|uniref:UTP--glucose-1-phosphate uridylyltransferase n=1 Tax=Pseudodesulfovibrio sp. zrk46 TaxID=2725288 RepID=UPI00144950D5|nr:UTP--glucose-1-phosphate uridylyltransferase [Pseudodesulfovibrio sp. zrk46]QJB55330.1 UTP--glucose-1-phosphate uridylyltransferase [Pseudodesulfovibrio sp. zrk46]
MSKLSKDQFDSDKFHTLYKMYADKMAQDGAPDIVINTFKEHFAHFLSNEESYLTEDRICPVLPDDIPSMDDLQKYGDSGRAALHKTAIIKLNGGLGTSMGLEGPKSFLPVKEGRTFLDLILKQMELLRIEHDASLPLLLMNSFWTDKATRERLANERNGDPNIPMTFVQHRYPRIRKDDLTPLSWEQTPELEWNPPGHGDIFTALLTSGLLRLLLLHGYRYVFVSNSDNLGAIFNADLLGYMVKENVPFLMEVCQRTVQDRKGGHLARLGGIDGLLGLREVAQCAPEDMDCFQDIDKYSFFNTNSIWLDLKAVEQAFLHYRQFSLQLIVNPKRAVPGDPNSPEVFQLETAMGAALSLFKGAQAVVVPRSRFSPVKTISDLMLTMSDCFEVTECNSVVCADWRKLPKINLDPTVYSTVESFFSRFPDGVPSMGNCTQLTVRGDVVFPREVILDGTVEVVNKSRQQLILPPGKNLSGKFAVA